MPPKKASVRKLQKSIPKESVVAKRKIHNSKDTDEIPNSEVNETADSLLNGKIETMSAEESNNLSTEESKVAGNKRGRKRAQKEIITENSLEEGKTDSEPVSKRGKKYQNIQLSDLEDDPVKIIRADSKPISKGRKEINSTAEPVDFKKSKQNERKTTKETESNSGEAIENVKIPGRRGKNVKNKNTTDESVNDKPSVDLEVANAELSENKTDKGNKKQKVSRKGKSDETLVLNKDIESGEKPGQSKNKKKDVKSDDPIENVQAADTQKINADKKSPKRGKKPNAAEKNVGSDVKNENRILKVSLTRDEEIEKLVPISAEKVKKLNETVKGEESIKTKGKRGRSKNTQSSEDGAKLSKVPKKTDSKGQSKKDKMPDVTLLDFNNNSTSASGKKWNLKLSSWNVNGIRAWLEKDGLAFIKHESPDIMCVQETKCSENKLPEEVNVEGYHSYWLAGDQEGYSGVGLLSKEKPLSVKYGIDVKEHDNEGRVITAEYEKFFLVNTYIPNAGRKLVRLDYRMKWDKDFCLYLKKLDSQKPVILCGDLNVAHEEIDLANPKTNKKNAGFTQEERDGFSALLREGFVDTFRHLNPDKKGAYTFWTYMMNARAKDVGWRLDYFVMSKRFVEDHLCDNVMRKEVMGSDHCPITLFLTI